MPKRYREWLFKDNIGKPRSTEARHAKKAAHSDGPSLLGGPDRVEDAAAAVGMPADALSGEESTSDDFLDDTAADPSLGSISDGLPEASDGQLNIVQSDSEADSATEEDPADALRYDLLDDVSLCSSDDEDLSPQHEPSANQTSELDEPLYAGSRVTVGESMVLILGHCLRHNTTKEATESLLKLIEAHVPEEAAIPTSKYAFFKQFTNARENATLHFYCPSCSLYLGERQAQELHCSTCGADFVVDMLEKKENYFLTFDIAKQVEDKLSLAALDFKSLPRQLSYDVGEVTTSQGYHNLPMSTHDLSV
ncbi:uncharacterized protein [Dermacentor albipictus]|uniref:uncharacterized protein n=1 Tax=Dermacentor albipictus TaxID=60249 RepID=UPI0031FC266A